MQRSSLWKSGASLQKHPNSEGDSFYDSWSASTETYVQTASEEHFPNKNLNTVFQIQNEQQKKKNKKQKTSEHLVLF